MFHSTIVVLYVAMNKFVQTLDKRLELLASKEGPATVAKKVRHDGAPSVSVPPINAPGWTVTKNSVISTVEGGWVCACMCTRHSIRMCTYTHIYMHTHTVN